MLKFDKGDKVKVVNAGCVYFTYVDAMKYFNIYYSDLYERLGFSWTDFDGQCYTVENVCLNILHNDCPVYLIHCDKGYLMIGENGIEFYNHTYERRSLYKRELGLISFKDVVRI